MRNSNVQQHTLLKSLGLHILPGALTTAAFLVFKPLLDTSGYPPLLAFLLAVILVDLPVLLGVMLVAGKKRNGRYSLEGVVLYRDKVSWVTFALVFVGAFVAVYALMMMVTPLSTVLAESAFTWLPDWMFLEERTQYQSYASNALLVTFVLQLVLTGVALPGVEARHPDQHRFARIRQCPGAVDVSDGRVGDVACLTPSLACQQF